MTQVDRERLRLKQDFLIMLCEMSGLSEQLRIDEKQGSPTIESLRSCVYPEWEWALDIHISRLADALSPKIGVPNFEQLITRQSEYELQRDIETEGQRAARREP